MRRPWPLAVWQARAAVLSGTPLDEYLRGRLAQYAGRLAVPRAGLPVRIEVVSGEILALPGDPPAPCPPRPPADAWASLVSLEGPSVLREVPELEARIASLQAEGEAARRRVEELSRHLADDVAAGRLCPAPRPEEGAAQLGRPPVRSPRLQLGLVALALALLLAEAWAIAVPALSAAGRYPLRLEGALRAGTVEAALTCTFALGIAIGLLALALVSLHAAEALAGAAGAARHRALGAAILAGIAAAAAVAAAAVLPAPRSGLPPPSHAILLLAVTASAAFLLRRARREQAGRSAEVAAVLAWDRARAHALGDRARRLEELSRAQVLVGEIEARRSRARARLDELAERSAAAARLIARTEQTERAERDRLARSLLGALERDRYEFLRQATVRGATELVSAPRKPPGSPNPPGAREAPPAEPGRMAS